VNKSGRRLVFAATVVVLLIIAGVVNVFFYPFTSAKPNFSDVERVFNKIVVPADWVEISISENRGIAGRACPIEPGTACFHKGARYSLAGGADVVSAVQNVFGTSGCENVSSRDHEVIGGTPYVSYECSISGLTVSGDLSKNPGSVWEVSVYVGD